MRLAVADAHTPIGRLVSQDVVVLTLVMPESCQRYGSPVMVCSTAACGDLCHHQVFGQREYASLIYRRLGNRSGINR